MPIKNLDSFYESKNLNMDVLFVIPNSPKAIYQNLANRFSAIEPPTWALLLASSIRKNKMSCEILDCDALRITD